MNPIDWFAKNSVAANLLMVLILVGGLASAFTIRQEVFPEISSELITITVPYLGAAPEEVEEAVCARIEERVQDLEGVKRVRSVAAEGVGTVTLELLDGADIRATLDDVKSRVDAIDTFPEETEKPIVQEIILRRQVIDLAISGSADERTLKHLGERVRDELLARPGITQAELGASRPYEVSIEVSEADLRRHNLTFHEVAQAVRRSSLDLPGGSLKTDSGEILLRTEGQAYRGGDFEQLVLLTRADGSRLTLGQVATVVDGFAETDQAARFDGLPAVLVQVFRVGDQDSTEIVAQVKDYVERTRPSLPEGVEITLWQDDTRVLKSRLDTLYRNGRSGLVLVLLVLALFLRVRLATWVSVGILVSFTGALWMMPTLGITVNVMSLFAFLIVLGIVVDDAIVVGENIYHHHEQGKDGVQAAIDGAREVAVPVIFSVLTTIAAFAPLVVVGGNAAKVLRAIPMVVIATLFFSLVESLLVMPSHLSHLKRHRPKALEERSRNPWHRLQRTMSMGMTRLVERVYRPLLERSIEWRYTSLALALGLLMLAYGLVASGRLKFTLLPPVEADNMVAFLTLPQGTPKEQTAIALQRLEESARELERRVAEEGEPEIFQHMLTSIGEQPYRTSLSRTAYIEPVAAAHLGEVHIELAPAETRQVAATELLRRWRALTGTIPEAVELTFMSSLISAGEPINIQLAGPNLEDLRRAADELKEALARYPGTSDIGDSFRAGKREVKLAITPEAEAMGLTLSDLARQVRQGFYGEEAQRIQRGRDELRVMVRYPEAERQSLAALEGMRIRTPDGREIPFASAGEARLGRGYASITRTDRRRTVNVTSDVDLNIANSNEILADLKSSFLPQLMARYRGLSYSLEGEQQQQRETVGGLGRAFLVALVVIYALLAIPFRSYLQPLIVMSAIPFGMLGAFLGHLMMGMDLTMLSAFGLVALTGVVVNDSLVLVDFINRRRRAGAALLAAICEAGVRRFRPIVLTSLTTFAGLTPLLLEKSIQAQFLIPMATSLAFGVLFATVIILLLVPVGYYILEDVKGALAGIWRQAMGSG